MLIELPSYHDPFLPPPEDTGFHKLPPLPSQELKTWNPNWTAKLWHCRSHLSSTMPFFSASKCPHTSTPSKIPSKTSAVAWRHASNDVLKASPVEGTPKFILLPSERERGGGSQTVAAARFKRILLRWFVPLLFSGLHSPTIPLAFTQVLSFHPPPPKRHTRTHARTQTRTKGSLLRYLLKRFDSSIKRRQTAAPSTARLPSVCSRSSGILLLLVLARLPMPSS